MSLKILGGLFKGRSLKVYSSEELRPTSVLLRRRVFDSVQYCHGFYFVDLCAGTGLMGLEALSRGCCGVSFFELKKNHFRILQENINQIVPSSLQKKVVCSLGDFYKFLSESFVFPSAGQGKVLFFLDPPYKEYALYQKFFTLLKDKNPSYAWELWVECEEKKGMPLEELEKMLPASFTVVKTYRQGPRYISKIVPQKER